MPVLELEPLPVEPFVLLAVFEWERPKPKPKPEPPLPDDDDPE
ncbi:MAG TPA: hypothetical protein VJ301_18815 [Propionibacteriaceae bacterium]|nr:hypothetical protein [Propionibacteriaceae bacterium]